MYDKEKDEAHEELANKLSYLDGSRPGEKMIHIEAFEYYYALGNSRNCALVGKKFNKNPRTISQWCTKFNWVERVKMRDIEISKKLVEKTTNAILDEKANYRKVIKLAMSKMIKELQADDFKSKGIQDLERLIKLDMLLMGENTEKVEVENKHAITNEDRQALKELSNNIGGLLKL